MNIKNTHTSSHKRSTYSQNETNYTIFFSFFAHLDSQTPHTLFEATEVSMRVSQQTQVAHLGKWFWNKLTWSTALSIFCQSRNRNKRLVGERSEKLPRRWATKHVLHVSGNGSNTDWHNWLPPQFSEHADMNTNYTSGKENRSFREGERKKKERRRICWGTITR